jgi:hypothetical protein
MFEALNVQILHIFHVMYFPTIPHHSPVMDDVWHQVAQYFLSLVVLKPIDCHRSSQRWKVVELWIMLL